MKETILKGVCTQQMNTRSSHPRLLLLQQLKSGRKQESNAVIQCFPPSMKTDLPGLKNATQTTTNAGQSIVWFELNVLPTEIHAALSYNQSVLVYLATMLVSET